MIAYLAGLSGARGSDREWRRGFHEKWEDSRIHSAALDRGVCPHSIGVARSSRGFYFYHETLRLEPLRETSDVPAWIGKISKDTPDSP